MTTRPDSPSAAFLSPGSSLGRASGVGLLPIHTGPASVRRSPAAARLRPPLRADAPVPRAPPARLDCPLPPAARDRRILFELLRALAGLLFPFFVGIQPPVAPTGSWVPIGTLRPPVQIDLREHHVVRVGLFDLHAFDRAQL